MLEVAGLRVRYRTVPALDGVDLTIGPGECVTLLGANGAGKTTLFRALSGLVPAEGTIRFDGHDVRTLRPPAIVALGIAQCPEGRKLFADLSVEKNLRLGAYVGRRDRRGTEAALARVCVLLAEQNAYAALSIAERGYVLANGRVVLAGSASALQANELVKKAFIGA